MKIVTEHNGIFIQIYEEILDYIEQEKKALLKSKKLKLYIKRWKRK